MKQPRVLSLVGDETGCVLWRVYSPFAALERRGYGAWFRHKDDPETYKPEFAYLATTRLEAIVIPRMFWRDQLVARRWISSLHRAGLAVIYELDDDVLTPQIGARQRATTEADKSLDELEQDRRDRIAAIRLCDGVTVSNDRLAAVVRTYVAPDTPVLTVPNRVDVRWFRSCVRGVRRDVPPVTVGWAGGARYAEDLEPLAEAWHNLARRYPDLTFVVQGHLADVLVQAVPAAQVRCLPWLPLTEYPRALLNIDIGCASVADNHFNRCKTPIKLWEYTLAGAVSVVSPTLYGDVAQRRRRLSGGRDRFRVGSCAEPTHRIARAAQNVVACAAAGDRRAPQS